MCTSKDKWPWSPKKEVPTNRPSKMSCNPSTTRTLCFAPTMSFTEILQEVTGIETSLSLNSCKKVVDCRINILEKKWATFTRKYTLLIITVYDQFGIVVGNSGTILAFPTLFPGRGHPSSISYYSKRTSDYQVHPPPPPPPPPPPHPPSPSSSPPPSPPPPLSSTY
eukprot:TRINITY_DN15221_c0_g1_i1.p1 TRINITY_DN15221_c0_g1~~TRINITY_DN15221_c0_g1_i1.p1  ORF type:complete len:166 (+),score=10.10 TRINITY_DN15221_c0_g1_i1:456-953(+)